MILFQNIIWFHQTIMPISIMRPGPVLCLLLRVSSDYAKPITGQVTEVTCPVIGPAQPELTLSKRQKTGPGLSLTIFLLIIQIWWKHYPAVIQLAISSQQFTTHCCTCHNSTAVRAKLNFHQILITMKNWSVNQAPEWVIMIRHQTFTGTN